MSLTGELQARPHDDPLVLWASVVARHAAGARPAGSADLHDVFRAAREELLPARPLVDALRREPDVAVLARVLTLPVEVLEDRLGDMDVALLRAQRLPGLDS
ncbi:hypothetical protein GKE82_26040 [Conexibacter sp. W3-3-2]|uniref:hypothetical protein n=1 Tax=Conexibacter sp. W3-3-2 TaxID=2675227 RepID=UPI0012B6E723|nr:hypothetical protein [Conexibacter sp. W3-3-2]MTD47666.1 hypothetical protein [Conexibacter sp. W3-3-2]